MLNAIYTFTGSVLKFLDGIFGSYLLAILAIALIIKLLLLPFGIKQQKNSIKQARMQPKEAAIRKKYAGRTDQASQQKLQQELMEMYQSGGYNPMSGCLPVVIQLPIIILLYNVIMNPLQYMSGISVNVLNHVATFVNNLMAGVDGFKAFTIKEGALAFRDISLLQYIPDNLTAINESLTGAGLATISEELLPKLDLFGSANALAANPTFTSWLILVPILNVLATFGSTLITRKLTFQPMQNGQQQGKVMNIVMMAAMPLLTGYIAFQVPAAIGIYWLFNNLLSVIQTVILYFAMPLPKFTEADYKAAEKELKGKSDFVSKRELDYRTRTSAYLENDDDDEINIDEIIKNNKGNMSDSDE